MSVLAMRVDRLRDDADVGDARGLHGVHDRGPDAKGDFFVAAHINVLVLRVANLLPQLVGDLVDVDGVVAEINALLFVDGDHKPLLGDFFHRPGMRNVNLDAGLQHRSGDHENNQQDEDDVDERGDVDVGERRLRAAIGSGEGHYRYSGSVTGGVAGRVAVARSTLFIISSEKSSMREPNSRIWLSRML